MSSRFYGVTPLVPASDLETAIAFYRDTLGFELRYRDAEPATFAIVGRDDAVLNLIHSDDRQLAEWTSLRIKVDDIDGLYQQYRAQDIIHPNGSLADKPWGQREFAVIDPSGVCITFHQPL